MNFAGSMIVGVILGAVIDNMGIGILVGFGLWIGLFKLRGKDSGEPQREDNGSSQG